MANGRLTDRKEGLWSRIKRVAMTDVGALMRQQRPLDADVRHDDEADGHRRASHPGQDPRHAARGSVEDDDPAFKARRHEREPTEDEADERVRQRPHEAERRQHGPDATAGGRSTRGILDPVMTDTTRPVEGARLEVPPIAIELGERFAAAGLRGERLHLAEEARYLLDLKGDAKAALAAAAENWKSQREPRDAAVLLEAALAAGDRKSATPVLNWLQESGFEDPRLRNLAARFK